MSAERPYRRFQGRKERRSGDRPRRGKGGIIAFLLASVVPVGGIVWFLLQPIERRETLLEKLGGGDIGGRALRAGIAFGILILLARVALPAFHGASGALRGVLARIRVKPVALRVLLFPVEFVVWLLWFGMQLLFALDAFLIIAAAVIGLFLAIRIALPDFLPNVLPQLR